MCVHTNTILYSTGSIGYHLCVYIQTQFQLAIYIQASTNEVRSLVNIQDIIPTFAGLHLLIIFMPAKVGIKSCKCTRECASFVHAQM